MDKKGDMMTSDEVKRNAQSLVDGRVAVKIGGIWDYKKGYLGRGGLFRRSGNIGVSIPKIPLKPGQEPEFQVALRIIKEVERINLTKGN